MDNYYICKYCGEGVEELQAHEKSCYARPEIRRPDTTLPLRRRTIELGIKDFIRK